MVHGYTFFELTLNFYGIYNDLFFPRTLAVSFARVSIEISPEISRRIFQKMSSKIISRISLAFYVDSFQDFSGVFSWHFRDDIYRDFLESRPRIYSTLKFN